MPQVIQMIYTQQYNYLDQSWEDKIEEDVWKKKVGEERKLWTESHDTGV